MASLIFRGIDLPYDYGTIEIGVGGYKINDNRGNNEFSKALFIDPERMDMSSIHSLYDMGLK